MKLHLIEAGALLLATAVGTVVGAALPADVTSPFLGPTSSSTMSSTPASQSPSATSGTSTSNSTSTLVTSGLSSPVAIPLPSTTTTTTSSPAVKSPTSLHASGAAPTAPCGTISSIWVASAASAKAIVSGTPSPVPTVPAALAHECLNSIPLDKDGALALVDALRPYLDWQSDLPWLKDPPAGYLFPPLDAMGYLDMIEANLKADKYMNEIEFETDLYQITAKMHSGHFGFYPDALTKVLSYARPLGLVTFGESTTTTPIIKLYEEVNANPATAQQISLINGQPANEYVEFWGNQATGSQDPDAGYNQMFFSRALVAAGSAEGLFKQGGRHKYFFPGAVTNFTYANGTTFSAPNYAYVLEDMTGVTDGASFYKKFCNPQAPGAGAGNDMAEKLVDEAADVVRLPGYPTPVLMSNDSTITAYYLDGDGYEDVAVIYANSFEPQLPPVFQKTVDAFIQMAKDDGKTKIIIDLQMNGGGYIFQGFDMYRQFFPSIREDGFNRWRESPQFVAGAQIVSNAVAGLNPYTSDNPDLINMYESWWNFRYDLNTTNQHFPSYEAKFGPHFYKGDPYTAVMKWDFNDPLTTTNGTFGMGMEITGYGSRANFTQPFPATHIIMLTDGYCASTCSLFQSAMKWQGGVRSIVFGGRPNRKPMNAVGGVKGSQVLGFYDIYNSTVSLVQQNGNETRVSDVQAEVINELTMLPINRSTSARINVRDSILRQNLGDGTPAQFIFEPADCRLYFTLDMHLDVSNMWKAAADAAWHGKPCVSGAGFTTVIDKRTDEERKELARRAAQRATVTVTVKDIPEEQAAFDWEKVRRKYNQKVRIM